MPENRSEGGICTMYRLIRRVHGAASSRTKFKADTQLRPYNVIIGWVSKTSQLKREIVIISDKKGLSEGHS